MNRSARETFACFSLRNRCGRVAKHVLAISKDVSVLRVEDCALTDMFRNLLSFLLCQHPALDTRDSILPILSSGQCRDVLREVHSRDVHGSVEESPHVDPIADNLRLQTIQICACSKASVDHLSRGLAIHSVCIHFIARFSQYIWQPGQSISVCMISGLTILYLFQLSVAPFGLRPCSRRHGYRSFTAIIHDM